MSRKRYQFCLNTSKNCFLCCQEIQFSDQNSKNPETGRKISLGNIFRYLKINICKLPSFSKKSSSILFQTDIRAVFCPACQINLSNFTSNYNDLIICKMKVDSTLQDILLKTSKQLYSTPGNEQTLKHFKIVKEVRESVFNRCKFKLSKCQPRIYLQKRWPKVQKKSPQSLNFEQNLNQDCKVEGNYEILSNFSVSFVDSTFDEGNYEFASVKQEVGDDAVDDFEAFSDEAFTKDSLAAVSANFNSKTKSTEKPFKCSKCPRSFQKNIHLVKHLTFHNTRTQLKCPHCEMAYFRKDYLREHLLQNHFAVLSSEELKEFQEFKCKHCSKYFRDRNHLAKHARTHAGKEKLQCPHCEQTFFRKGPLKMHIKLVHRVPKVKKETLKVTKLKKKSSQLSKNKKSVKERSVKKIFLKCAHCGVVHTRCSKLRGHLLKTHFQSLSQEELDFLGEVRCKYCLKYCLDKASLARHVRTHTRETPFECRHCPEKFSSRAFLTCHVLNAHKNLKKEELASSVAPPDIKKEPDEAPNSQNKKQTSVRKCPHCDKAFPNKLYFFKHLRITHLDLLNEKDLQKLNPYKCTQCSRTFPNKTKYSAHVRSHTGEKPFKCSYCPSGFIRKDNLVRHLKTHEVKQKECKICKEKFPTEAKLLAHSLVHPEVEKFQCQECQKLFLSSQSLQGHMQVHSGGHRRQCKICLKVFANSTQRDEHLQEEHKELESTQKTKKIYNCSICNEKQFRLRNFEAHMRKHTGERLICEHCPASFIHPDKLKKHLRKHLPPDQQFVCSICKMLFASDESLQKHKGTHGKTGRPECNLCGKTFASKMNLFSHQKEVHSGEKPHQCDICGKGFSRVQRLRGHQKVHSENQ